MPWFMRTSLRLRSAHPRRHPQRPRAVPSIEVLESRQMLSLTPVADGAQHTDLFTIGVDHQVYELKFNQFGDQVSPTTLATTGGVNAITATESTNGAPLLFALGLDDRVYELQFDSNGDPVSDFIQTEAAQVKAIQAVTTPDAVLVFAIGGNNELYVQRYDQDGHLLAGFGLTQVGEIKSFQAVASGRRAFVFAIGLDDEVYQQRFNSSGDSLGPYNLVTQGQVKDIQVGVAAPATPPSLYVLGLDDQVYAFNPATSSYDLTAPGEVKAFSLNVVPNPGDSPYLQVVAIGPDDQLYAQHLDDAGDLVYGPTSPRSIVQLKGGERYTFVIGADCQIYEQRFDGQGFPLGDYLATDSGPVLC